MAKQCGSHRFTGKLGATIGYKNKHGEDIERENGSKTGRSFRRDPRRKRTMEYARMFAKASKAVTLIYYTIPKDQRQHGVYGKLSGMAFSMIKNGQTVEEVKAALTRQYVEDKVPLVEVEQKIETGTSMPRTAPGDILAPVPDVAVVRDTPGYVVTTIARPYFYSTNA
ncbi:hypothetical protein HB364_23245 [Pseudoflavitalea sp. X16]|uniref:hypothetical protein n=1 Tax=Paraflavitalea devenefica TaxID=2716334 RepID=UPI001420335E|nr:hypothetical protein [Paraflavitalea devenefica]NII28020.1 hypothetical protein [Paraflavitalea devenefica]